MSDREFENYLTLIGRLLRLSSAQRELIGAELRDHFESRLNELTSRGISHDAAVKIALEEFGDAAGLASQFSRIAQTRKRRLIMRCTLASAAALAAALVVAISLWPENHAPINHAVGQTAEKQAVDKLEKAAQTIPDNFTAITNAKLDRFIEAYIDDPISLGEFVSNWIKQKFDVEGICDMDALKQAGIDPSATLVNMHLSHVRGTMLLDLLLKQFSLTYRIRDGIIIVTTKDKAGTELEVRIYDTRAILAHDTVQDAGDKASAERRSKPDAAHGAGTGVDGQTAEASWPKFHFVQAGGAQQFAPQSAAPQPEPRHPPGSVAVDRLINVITGTIETESWSEKGGVGTISEYGGLLVIGQTDEVHRKVADLLEQLESRLKPRAEK